MEKVKKISIKKSTSHQALFFIWRLQRANPEKQVIPENQGFGFWIMSFCSKNHAKLWLVYNSKSESLHLYCMFDEII